MGRTRRRVVVVGGVCGLAVLALGARLAGAPDDTVGVLDLATSAAFLGIALAVPRKYREQRAIALALGLAALGDLFLSGLAPVSDGTAHALGIAFFLAGYLALTVALLHGRPHPVELLLLLPYLGIGTAIVWALGDQLTGVALLVVPIVLLVIATVAWAGATTLTRTHFVPRVRVRAAAGGAVLFASYAAVALAMLYPPFQPEAPLALQVFIRASYVAGWLLMVLIACDPAPRETAVSAGAGGDEVPAPTRR